MAKKTKSSFTIVELLIVIVVIGILAAITMVAYTGIQKRARDAQRQKDIQTIAKAMEMYYVQNGRYPVTSVNASADPKLINNSWVSSNDTGWPAFEESLRSAGMGVDKLPKDPINKTGSGASMLVGADGYHYSLFVNGSNYCGGSPGKMYLLLYKLESGKLVKDTVGECSSNELGNGYGTSYYRVIKPE